MRSVIAYTALIGLAGVFLWVLARIWLHGPIYVYEVSLPILILETIWLVGVLIIGIERFISSCRKP